MEGGPGTPEPTQQRPGWRTQLYFGALTFTLGAFILSVVVIQVRVGLKQVPLLLIAAILILGGLLTLQGAVHARRAGPHGPQFWVERIKTELLEGPWQRFVESVWRDVALVGTGVLGTAGWAVLAARGGWSPRWLFMGVLVVWPLTIAAAIGVRGLLARHRRDAER